jgi:hypothetical protein
VEVALAEQSSGVIIAPASDRHSTIEPLLERGIPVVTIDRRLRRSPVSAVLTQNAKGAEAATAERERLARSIHDSVLQVLARVRKRGAEIGGEAAELAALAGEQEVALRSLVASAPHGGDAGETADLRAVGVGIEPTHADGAGARRKKSGNEPQGRRLARPVVTEQPEDLSGLDREVDAVDGDDVAERASQAGQGELGAHRTPSTISTIASATTRAWR